LAELESVGRYFEHAILMWPAKYQVPQNTVFKGRLVILIDGGCFSAKEDFIVPFKDNHRAILIGERTLGSSGQPYFYNFDQDLNLGIGTKREYFPDGSRFEGVGIAPDIEVIPTVADIKAGLDPVMQRAVKLTETK
jgi:carboxyl-terminal processing protease